jgi:hypothetical protein
MWLLPHAIRGTAYILPAYRNAIDMTTQEYVEAFGKMLFESEKGAEVERLILSIPDSTTFQRIRYSFLERYRTPFLPAFLKDQPPETHKRILIAFKKACGNYE